VQALHEDSPQQHDAGSLNRVSQITRSSSGSPGASVATTSFTYDDWNRVTNMQHTNSTGGNIANYTYGYDAAGNVQSEVRNGTTTTYSYDADNQLTNGAVFTYDAAGNRNMTGYATGTGNEMTNDGVYTYTYDANGNEKTKSNSTDSWSYSYDNRNELTSVTHTATGIAMTATYSYDAFGNRIKSDVTLNSAEAVTKYAMDGWDPATGTGTGNDNWNVLADLTSTGSLKTRYLRGDAVDEVFAQLAYNGSTFTPNWYLTDVRGSVRDIIDNSDNLKDSITYDGFGKITAETNSSNRGRYAWTGRELDVETNLQYNRARYYDAATGRWISQDPIGFDAGDSNLYRYVRNRPDSWIDPSGWFQTSSGTNQSKELKDREFTFNGLQLVVDVSTGGDFKYQAKDIKNAIKISIEQKNKQKDVSVVNIDLIQTMTFSAYNDKNEEIKVAFIRVKKSEGGSVWIKNNELYIDSQSPKSIFYGSGDLNQTATQAIFADRPNLDTKDVSTVPEGQKVCKIQALFNSFIVYKDGKNVSFLYQVNWRYTSEMTEGQEKQTYDEISGQKLIGAVIDPEKKRQSFFEVAKFNYGYKGDAQISDIIKDPNKYLIRVDNPYYKKP
jgi:RHS repeat-associated protein